jgi:heterodisulfide reductase subunit A-like polyferredoxin
MKLPLAVLLLSATLAQAVTESDVIVYGATPGGFCAAIAAAREGVSVILLEPADHVGGRREPDDRATQLPKRFAILHPQDGTAAAPARPPAAAGR